jgi:hypothetical protein
MTATQNESGHRLAVTASLFSGEGGIRPASSPQPTKPSVLATQGAKPQQLERFETPLVGSRHLGLFGNRFSTLSAHFLIQLGGHRDFAAAVPAKTWMIACSLRSFGGAR